MATNASTGFSLFSLDAQMSLFADEPAAAEALSVDELRSLARQAERTGDYATASAHYFEAYNALILEAGLEEGAQRLLDTLLDKALQCEHRTRPAASRDHDATVAADLALRA